MATTILVTGGAGYIGSHTAWLLAQKGYNIIVLDDFLHDQTFNPSWATIIKSDFADSNILQTIFSTHTIDAVMHFAAFIEVGKSVTDPLSFYHNNVAKTTTLLQTMCRNDVKKIIFSSSCAVYGNPHILPLSENHPQNPISPYGRSKQMVETMLADACKAYNLSYVSLRYFNAAGALPEYGLGEQHQPETHIIPLILRAIQQQKPFTLFGTDHKTTDGTCIRDYIHVRDIAEAHWRALEHLNQEHPSDSFNLGSGKGTSILELVNAVEQICNKKIAIVHQKKREGDPPILIADSSKAHDILQWKPRYSDLHFILQTALTFENMKYQKKPNKHTLQVQ